MAQIKLDVTVNTQNANTQIKALNGQIKSLANSLSSIKPNKDLTAQLNSLAKALNASAKSMNAQTKAEKNHAKQLKSVTEAGKKATKTTKDRTKAVKDSTAANEKHTQSILSMAKGFLSWQVAATVVMQAINLVRNAFDSLNETLVNTEKATIEITRILNENISDQEVASKLYDLAEKYGQTFENISEIATNFARAGYEWTDVMKLAEGAVLALNVAELDATQASDGLIAILKQFKLPVEEIYGVVDMLNKQADNAPVSTEKLLLALQKAGSYADQANLSLKETVAIITALSGATNASGQQLGTAVKSLLAYTTKSGSLDVYASLSDRMAAIVAEYRKGAASILDVWQGLSDEINHLTAEQADKLAEYAESDIGSTLESALSEEMGEIYDSMTGVYDTAGTYRKNFFIALMKNMDDVKESMQTLDSYAGYSAAENLKQLNTYEARVNSLKAQWQKLANDEQGVLALKKDLVEVGSAALDVVDKLGGISTILTFLGVLGGEILAGVLVKGIVKFVQTIKLAATASKTAAAAALAHAAAVNAEGDAALSTAAKTEIATKATNAQAAADKAAAAAALLKKAAIMAAIVAITASVVALIKRREEMRAGVKAAEEFAESVEFANKQIKESQTSAIGQIVVYEDLLDVYDELNGKEKLDAQERERLATTVEKLQQKFGDMGFVLDQETGKWTGNTEAIRENIKKRKEQIELEYSQNRALQAYTTMQNTLEQAGFANIADLESAFSSATFAYKWTKDNPYSFPEWADVDPEKTVEDYQEETKNRFDELKRWVDTYSKESDIYYAWISGEDEITKSIIERNKATKTTVTLAKDVLAALKAQRSELEEQEKLQDKQNALLKAQKELEEAIAKAKREYILSVLEDYLDKLETAATLEEKQNAIIEARKELQEAAEKAKRDAIIAALKAEQEQQDAALTLEEKRLAVEEARQALLSAKQERDNLIYNAASDQWEWQENQKTRKQNTEKLNDAIEKLDEYLEKQAWDEIIQAVEDGKYSPQEIEEILSRWANLGENKNPQWAQSIRSTIKSFENYVPSESDLESATSKVTSAIESLNDFLKNQAIAELKDAINSGNASSGNVNAILAKWLGKGEGAEIWQWGSDVASKIAQAVASGYYDQSSVASAREKVATAQSALTEYFTSRLWDEVLDALEKAKDGGVPYETINAIVKKYRELGADSSVIGTVLKQFGNKNSTVSGGKHMPGASNDRSNMLYDEGGVLNGTGGIKACAEDEIVLPPSIAKRILNPTANAQFRDFTSAIGALFDNASVVKHLGKKQGIITNIGNTDNSNRSTQYYVNGVPIPASAAERYTIKELFGAMPLAKSK